jgi:4-amino-4-deoxy-L-arabinose transferase-like glycosyltransferase
MLQCHGCLWFAIDAVQSLDVKIRKTSLITLPLLLAGFYFVVLFCHVVWHRIQYPVELELIEGSSVNHVLRIVQGEPMFIAPTFEFTPNLYTPLFYFAGALVAPLTGVGFMGLRLVSVLAVVGTVLLIACFVYRETSSRTGAFIAASTYLATYAASGGWMDLARVDSLFVLLLWAGIYGLRYAESLSAQLATALVCVLAFYAKQSALIAVTPLLLYPVWMSATGKHRLWLPFAFITGLLFSLGLVDWMTDRWFTYYTIVMPAGHPNNSRNESEFWLHDLIQVMPVAIIFAAGLILAALKQPKKYDAIFLVLLIFSTGLCAYLTRINKGGYYNNLMPFYATLSLCVGLFIGKVLESGKNRAGLLLMVVGAGLLQFWLLSYNPKDYMPQEQDWQESRQLLSELKTLHGNIYAPDFGFLGYLVGKQTLLHSTSYEDIRLSRYQYWANTDLHLVVENKLDFMMRGIARNHVNALVLVNDSADAPEPQMGDFVLKKHYISTLRTQAWSDSTFWFRSWPMRTMYHRPDVLLYVREPANGL